MQKKSLVPRSYFIYFVEKYYKNFSQRKVPFSNRSKLYITYENSANILDCKKTDINSVQTYIKME